MLTHTIDSGAVQTSDTATLTSKVKGKNSIGDSECNSVVNSDQPPSQCNGSGDSMVVETV